MNQVKYVNIYGPAWQKTCKQSSFCVGVIWQTQSRVKHLAQTKKKKYHR